MSVTVGREGSLAVGPDEEELAGAVRRWVRDRCPISVTRRHLEAEVETLPSCWAEMGELGWTGLAVGEARGGSGAGIAELALVVEELGRGCVPGPFLPTAVVAAAIDRWAAEPELARPLAEGRMAAGIGLTPGGPVWGASAERFLLPLADGGWGIVDRADLDVRELPSLDASRRLAEVQLRAPVDAGRRLVADADPLSVLAVVAGAEAVGVASWCVATAAGHAVDRVQFGRPIGQFQAVKHRCADALVATEAARALVWDAARALDQGDEGAEVAVAAAAARAPLAAAGAAKDCIQVLGGIGYTWEHDAHLYLKRAMSTLLLLPPPEDWHRRLVAAMRKGVDRTRSVELPPEAEPHRVAVREFLDGLRGLERAEWNREIARSGYLVPHWPRPWGLDADPLHQLVIDAEFRAARVRRPHLQVAAWVLPTIIGHGSPDQTERFVMPSLLGDLRWCQLFSEPGAGSDLASLSTRAVRVDGGWSLTGQKVWTTMARHAEWGLCLARTDPTAERHDGITCFLVDMRTPGIDVRPLRELTGLAMFNEVFLDDVVVPDDCVVGPVGGGWECARTTLANERVSMAAGSSFGPGLRATLDLVDRRGDPVTEDHLGALAATEHAVAMLALRTTLRAIGGGEPGPEASVRKLLGVEHEQEIQELGLTLLGPAGAVGEGEGATWTAGFLGNRALSIAGGTSEIQRNVIAERLLGLPRDP